VSLRLIVIPLALLTALALALILFQISHAPPAVVIDASGVVAPPPLQVSILVAAHPVPPGTLIRDEDFVPKAVAQHDVPEHSVQDTMDARNELRGALVRKFLDTGVAVARSDVLRTRDRGFLAAVLEPGTRAVSIGVDAITGVSGLIWPGDRVDVILTQESDGQNAPPSRRVFGETVLTDVRVIAVDQQITEGGSPAAGADGVGKVARTVTVQVAADQAERITVAGRMGHLALAIRSIDGAPPLTPAAAPTIFGSDVSPELQAAARRGGQRMRVIQGEKREEVTFQ
jgi:pilus assembly protein CpaB